MPAAVAIPAAVSAATSIGGALIGSSAAKKAAAQQAAAGQKVGASIDKATSGAIDAGYAGITQANAALNENTGKANGVLSDVYNNLNGAISPYQQAGKQGVTQLSEAMAPGGSLSEKFSFNPSDLENDPGYQFTLAQGLKAITNSASARGLVGSGGTMQSMDKYTTGLAQTTYGNAYNRALTSFQTNHNNTLGDLTTLANFGQNANSQAIGIGQNYGNQTSANYTNLGAGLGNVAMNGNQYVGNVGLHGAEAAGQAYMGGANAAAAGTVGSANALAGGLNGIANGVQTAYANYNASQNGEVQNVNAPQQSLGGFIPLNVSAPQYQKGAGPAPSVMAPPPPVNNIYKNVG